MELAFDKDFDSDKILTPDISDRLTMTLQHRYDSNYVYYCYGYVKDNTFDIDKFVINNRDGIPSHFFGEMSKFRT